MEVSFYKYQGTGNDFIMVDDRQSVFHPTNPTIGRLCDRKFGIGADGLILIRSKADYDFEMVYFNADGTQSMCGNGARCAVAFSNFLGIVNESSRFWAIDGPHEARFLEGQVELGMSTVHQISNKGEDYFVNTGSPHHVKFVEDVRNYPVVERGAPIRYCEEYKPGGTNVNFVSLLSDNEIFVRTYERGVENETLSCGTGVTACALVVGKLKSINSVSILTPGGKLKVDFTSNLKGGFDDILLTGPAEQVFSGKVEV